MGKQFECGKFFLLWYFSVFLTVLSKEGAIELKQGEDLQIVNIVPGVNIEIYIWENLEIFHLPWKRIKTFIFPRNNLLK